MAQSIVSNVAGKLGELLIQEVNFLQGVDGELRSLSDEFQWIQAFLNDADASIQGGNKRAQTWVNQVRDVSYDAEDIIDNYIFKIHLHHHRVSHGCFSSLTTYARHPSRLTILHDLGIEIGKVKRRVEEISANRSKYGIDSIGATSSSEAFTNEEARPPLSWKQTSPVVEEVDVIGFDEHVNSLKQLLLAEVEGRRAVVSIVGMGGLGKTTLAKKVFSKSKIKRHFACHAWVYVSQSYRDREIVESIAKQLMVVDEVRMNKLTDEELKKKVYEHLEGRRYLVVLDDVWTRGAWDNIKEMLPEITMNGSKVLLTTRNREVALRADRQSPPFDLKLLGEEESWELFCKKAIPTKCREHCPPELETIGREMVAKCGGLPLAIVVLGGLALTKEQSEGEWRKLLKSVIWQLREGEDQISKILALSYHHLPYDMKPCFLYFAMFPEDSVIDAKDLRLKWIAEGFIETRDEETTEEVAEDYLEELVHRSLVQVAERDLLGGIVKCRIHDLLLDLAISEAKGMNFLLVTETKNNNDEGITTLLKTRRLAIHADKSWDIAPQYLTDSTQRSLRSIIVFGMEARNYKIFQTLISSMKLLRVIYLRNVGITLPKAIGELIHLRYLNVYIRGRKPHLPSSMGELTNLQTLQIGTTSLGKLASETLKKLCNLRHLDCSHFPGRFYPRYSEMRHLPICDYPMSIIGQASAVSLPNLQTLAGIKAGKWLYDGLLEKMTNLRKLNIDGVSNSYGEALSNSLGKLNNLIDLVLSTRDDYKIPTSILTASNHNHLRHLALMVELEKLPEVSTQCLLTNLITLNLLNSKLKVDPLVTLGKLDYLQALYLWDAFVGEKMVCLEKAFPQLKELAFVSLRSLEEWKIEDETMPRLRKLIIHDCRKLVMLPHGLGRITSLQELNVLDMPTAFTHRLRDNDGEDWDKVRHIPSLIL